MNIPKISQQNFKGVYLSNSLDPGKQHDLGKEVQKALNVSGYADSYEKEGKDLLIVADKDGGVKIVPVKHSAKRLLDDNYSRWNGRF